MPNQTNPTAGITTRAIWIGLLATTHQDSEIEFPGYERQLLLDGDNQVVFTATAASDTIHPKFWAAFPTKKRTQGEYAYAKLSGSRSLTLRIGETIGISGFNDISRVKLRAKLYHAQ